MRGSNDSTSMLQVRTHSVFFGKHAKLFNFIKETEVTKLEAPVIGLKFGISLYILGLLSTDQAVPVFSIHFGHIH